MALKRCIALLIGVCLSAVAEERIPPTYRTDVNEVVVHFVVKDATGKIVRDLARDDFQVLENGKQQEILEFMGVRSAEFPTSVYLLIDCSNVGYRGYVYMVETATNFVRRLPPDTSVAVYTFSRNLHRVLALTHDRIAQLTALYTPQVGDDPALYNSILLTIRDAAKQPGRKAIVAFTSHGTDYASMISPDDVARVAEDEGISIHVIAGDKPAERVTPGFARVTEKTGGAFYTLPKWKFSSELFDRVQDDLTNCYTVSYRSHNPPDGKYRRIQIGVKGRSLHVLARQGYTAPQNEDLSLTAMQHPSSE